MQIKNATREVLLTGNCRVANNFMSRFLGLMGTSSLPQGSGLLIKPCNSIHMFFMKYPLDIIFISSDNTIVYLMENIKPWNFSKIVRQAVSVLELPAGTISLTKTIIGDKILMVSNGYTPYYWESQGKSEVDF